MNVILEFGESPADLTIMLRGAPVRDDVQRVYRELPAHPNFRKDMKILLDLSEITAPHLSGDDSRAVGVTLAQEETRYGRAAMAVFAPAPVSFGLSRLSVASAAFKELEISVHRTYDEAVAWLAERDEA